MLYSCVIFIIYTYQPRYGNLISDLNYWFLTIQDSLRVVFNDISEPDITSSPLYMPSKKLAVYLPFLCHIYKLYFVWFAVTNFVPFIEIAFWCLLSMHYFQQPSFSVDTEQNHSEWRAKRISLMKSCCYYLRTPFCYERILVSFV